MNKFAAIDQAVPFVVIERGRSEGVEGDADWAVCLNEKVEGGAEFEAVAEEYQTDILSALESAQALSTAKGYPLVINDDAAAAIMESLRELQQAKEESFEHGTGVMSRVPVISTGHLTHATTRLLERMGDDNPWAYFASYRDGHMIRVPSVEIPLQDMSPNDPPLPDDLKTLWVWAREQGVNWVRLDMDADQVDDLPFYNWEDELRVRKIPSSASPEM